MSRTYGDAPPHRRASLLVAAAVLAFTPAATAATPTPPVGAPSSPAAPPDTVEGPAAEPFRRPPVEVLRARRAELLDSLGAGLALVRSASPVDIEAGYPQASDFRQNNDFLYLTGLETPDSWLMLAARRGGGTTEVLFVPERDTARERWTGRQPGPEEASRRSGIDRVRTTAEFERMAREGRFGGMAGQLGPLWLPLNHQSLGSELVREIAAGTSAPVRDVEPEVARLRLVKDEFELELLRRAVAVTDEAHRAAMRAAEPGMYEYGLESVIEYTFHRHGAERVGFPSIVGSGPNSTVLHYDASRRRMEAGDLVVMDVGAEYSYYTADVTRTIPVSGEFTDRQRALYELVLGALEAAVDAVRPGATVSDVSRAARRHLRRSSGDLCGRESCEAHFTHGVGHWLGMDVHDVGDYAAPFRPGMVLTVEPGVYLPAEDLGIRIEEDVLVTEDGREVLSEAPRTVEAIEALMAEAWRPDG